MFSSSCQTGLRLDPPEGEILWAKRDQRGQNIDDHDDDDSLIVPFSASLSVSNIGPVGCLVKIKTSLPSGCMTRVRPNHFFLRPKRGNEEVKIMFKGEKNAKTDSENNEETMMQA